MNSVVVRFFAFSNPSDYQCSVLYLSDVGLKMKVCKTVRHAYIYLCQNYFLLFL